MAQLAKRIQLRNPDRAKAGPRIEQWKYDAIKRAILHIVPRKAPGLAFAGLAAGVSRELARADRLKVGSMGWYTTVVKLDLEARGYLRRLPGIVPQRLIRLK
jgi:Family of unknown function (DUF6958)